MLDWGMGRDRDRGEEKGRRGEEGEGGVMTAVAEIVLADVVVARPA